MSHSEKTGSWTIAEARRRFSELVRAASRVPQILRNRDRPVAAVVDADTFEEFERWRAARRARSVADAFEELRRLCEEEAYALPLADRRDREDGFAVGLE